MGAAESNPVRNLDKRTARRQYSKDFSYAVERYRKDQSAHFHTNLKSPDTLPNKTNESSTTSEEEQQNQRPVQCFIRKRPIFPREIKGNEFDVISCGPSQKTCTVHDARMKADMRNRTMTHYEFSFDRVFDDDATNEEVFDASAAKLVDLMLAGTFTTCLMYGQTGSGKTYTMSALYEHAAVDLFSKIDINQFVVSVSFVEIAGDHCNDLLNRFQDAPLLTAQDGLVWPYPIVEIDVNNPNDLISFVRFGSGVRTTSATGEYSKRRRSNVAVIIVEVIFIRSFLFYCLLCKS